MKLHRIVYCSEVSSSNSVSGVDLASAIAATSQTANRKNQLTGSLVFVAGNFIQVLEGPLEALETTFERICCDSRHLNLKLLEFREIPERQFGSWSMACLTDGNDEEAEFCAMLGNIRSSLMISVPESLQRIKNLLER